MEERNEISVELSALSALVSGISRQTPYRVPDGYFDRLPALLMGRIAGPAFQVPKGYFDQFATSVLARIKAGMAAPESSILSGISRESPYRLPEGYFDELSPVLALLKDKPAFEVPEGYFEALSPVLTVAHDRSAYQVPAGYFDSLPEQILQKVNEPVEAAKVVSMRPLQGHWWRYSSAAAAAIAACFLLIFSLPAIDTNRESVLTAERGLEKLSDQDLQAYLDQQQAMLAETVDQHPMLAETATNSTATLDMNEGDVKSLLSGVSDDDLQQYMDEHGKAEDLATN
jgi:hypothetical protein